MTMRLFRAVCLSAAVSAVAALPSAAQVNVTTFHYDNLRTGWNPNETVLTQSNLSGSGFGLNTAITLDGTVQGQPLFVSNETIAGGQHDVVYVATENDSVYAIDAGSGQILVQTSLGPSVSRTDVPGCHRASPRQGIDSTPVIDLSTGTLYAIAYTWEDGVPIYRIHALSLTTLADTTTPVEVSASGTLDDGATYDFNPAVQRQRTGLLLANGTIYAGFGSFCDRYSNEARGWVMGWQAGTLAPLSNSKLNNRKSSSPNNFFLSSVWMSGYGIATNSTGSIFFVTGNSDRSGTTFDKVTNIAESAAKMSADLSTVQDLFTPANHKFLDTHDLDFGSGGLMLLPQQTGSYPDLAAAAGKDGTLYLLNADQLSQVLNSQKIGACWCGPSYYQGSDGSGRIVSSGGTTLGLWAVQAGPKLVQQWNYPGIPNGQLGGFLTSVSSNGTAAGTAVVWAVSRPANRDPGFVDLYAFNADTGALLFNGAAGQWQGFGGIATIVPVVANGHVFVASDQTLSIFGMGSKPGATLPKLPRSGDADALPPGQHEIYGIVAAIKGSRITIRDRTGRAIALDATAAIRNHQYAPPNRGDGLFARGSWGADGSLDAGLIQHAAASRSMWPRDR